MSPGDRETLDPRGEWRCLCGYTAPKTPGSWGHKCRVATDGEKAIDFLFLLNCTQLLSDREKAAIRSLLERLEDYDKQGRDLEDLAEQRDVVMRREAALKERLEAAEQGERTWMARCHTADSEGLKEHEESVRLLIEKDEENERLKRDLAISHAAQSASAEGWHQETKHIEAALALHKPWVSSMGTKFCEGCSSGYGKIPYPCPTVKALKGEGE